MKPNVLRNGVIALWALAAGAEPVGAATNLVRMTGSLTFVPRLLTNSVGDTVLWTNVSSVPHNVVSSNNAWTATAPFPSPGTFRVTFTTPGVYGYYCAPHQFSGMNGIIYVQPPPNAPPTVALTNPAPGTVYAAPATIALRAMATDPDGSVTNVQFFNGANLLGAVAASPFTLAVSNLGAATYNFTARAFDNAGAVATSAVVSVQVVAPGPIRFDTGHLNAGATFPLRVTVTPGLRYAIEYVSPLTTNQANWLLFTNFTATNPVMTFSSPKAGVPSRFFRARLLPNP